MDERALERINSETMLKMFNVFMRYSCLTTQKTNRLKFQTQDGNRKVEIDNPVNSVRSWKAFLYCLWKAEKVESVTLYGKEIMVVSISKEKLQFLLRPNELTLRGFRDLLRPLAHVMYWLEEKEGNKIKYSSFRLIHLMEGEEDIMDAKQGFIRLYVDGAFYRFCMNSNVFMYVPFLVEIHSIYTANLFMYLTANWDARNFSEELLFERVGLHEHPEKKKRYFLKEAFQALKTIGYIKDFHYDETKRKWIVERYDTITLKAIAISKLKHFEVKEKEKREKVRKQATERQRRRRAKEKEGLQKDIWNF